MVRATARSTSQDDPEALDVVGSPWTTVLLRVGGEPDQLLIRDGLRRIRLELRGDDVLAGPVRLRFELASSSDMEPELLTLRRISALLRLGRVPARLHPAERRVGRWIKLLRTLDGLAAGASYRELSSIAGGKDAPSAWRGDSDYLRLRVQRLARTARLLRDGGYLGLMAGSDAQRSA